MLNRILQWNCRGVKGNYEETLLLFKDYEPAALCLQETHLKDTDNISIRNYTAFHTLFANNKRAAGGVSVYINNNAPHSHITFQYKFTGCCSKHNSSSSNYTLFYLYSS